MRHILLAGADKISINTSALENPDLITEGAMRFGCQCMVVAVDARRVPGQNQTRWEVFTHGGRTSTGLDAIEWAVKAQELGAGEILLTSMDRDGTKDGYDLELTVRIAEAVKIPVLASGGVGNLEHLYEGLTVGKASAALAASIFHFGQHTIHEAKAYLQERGVVVRN